MNSKATAQKKHENYRSQTYAMNNSLTVQQFLPNQVWDLI